jgi:hypothetical protein
LNFEELFDEVSNEMISSLNQARLSLTHSASKGTAYENTLIDFLRKYLPKFLGVSSGFIVDADGKESKQLDIIIFDANKAPIFFQKESIRIIPIECVYAVIEVKAYLRVGDLEGIFKNMMSVRQLEKKAYVRPTENPRNTIATAHHIYDREWEIWPVHYFVFALDSVGLESIVSAMTDKITKANLQPWTRIDTVGVLSKGVICNQRRDRGIDAMPSNDSTVEPIMTEKALLLFYILISTHLLQAMLPPLRLNDYVKHVRWM